MNFITYLKEHILEISLFVVGFLFLSIMFITTATELNTSNPTSITEFFNIIFF